MKKQNLCSAAAELKKTMKISKSKQELARIISENGGWPERALWAAQDNCIAFFLGGKPEYKSGDRCWYSNSIDGVCVGTITCDEKVTNWHQTILSREEYFFLYQEQGLEDALNEDFPDSDGWIEWKGGACPVDGESIVDVELNSGNIVSGVAKGLSWRHEWKYSNVIAYRLHKPQKSEPQYCESVTRSIPEPDELIWTNPPTIEQLAADYRNAKDYAERKQQEADAAKADAEAKLTELVAAGKPLGLVLSVVGV